MRLSDVDAWSVPALHTISHELRSELHTIAELDVRLSAASTMPSWDSVAADAVRARIASARTDLMGDVRIITAVAALAEETARVLTELKFSLEDLRADVASFQGHLYLSDSGQVTADESVAELHPIAAALEAQAAEILRTAEQLDLHDGDVLANLGGSPFSVDVNGSPLVSGTDQDDVITVRQSPVTGLVVVTVNGESQSYTTDEARGMVIDTMAGDDVVHIEPEIESPTDDFGNQVSTMLGFTVEAGAGNDRIRTGSGRDYVNGSTGNDQINGGAGEDTLYGGDGDDRIGGSTGNDYVDGGMGNDRLDGGAGNDLVHGGRGDDQIMGNAGDDVLVTGAGVDQVSNDGGIDVIKAQTEDIVAAVSPGVGVNLVQNTVLGDLPDNVVVAGDAAFSERVFADLELYRSTDTGQAMLTSLGSTPYDVVITEETDLNSYAHPPVDNEAVISFNPSDTGGYPQRDPTTGELVGRYDSDPAATLFHEMAHVYDYAHGTLNDDIYSDGEDPVDSWGAGVPNSERVAVGLPIDTDNDHATPEAFAAEHPLLLTENAFRAEVGLPQRHHYGYGGQ